MGQNGPLDHPDLREVERLLDTRDLAAAQRVLSGVGPGARLADGVAYLTTRLLSARGRLDAAAVADRLRDILAKSPDFPEAAALLAEVERRKSGSLSPVHPSGGPPADAAPRMTPPPEQVAISDAPDSELEHAGVDGHGQDPDIDTSVARRASWPPEPPAKISVPNPTTAPPTVPASPQAPRPARPSDPASDAPPTSRDGTPSRRRYYAPLAGMDSFLTREKGARPSAPPSSADVPEIPKAPALPQFRDNYSAPSYAPPRHEPDFDALRTKSLLPRNAGRYSQSPAAPEVVGGRKGRESQAARGGSHPPGTASSASETSRPPRRVSSGVARETVPGTPDRIRSSGSQTGPLPTLFEIASWIDEGRHKDAIAAINRAGTDAGADYAVLRARALAAAGYVDQAFDALARLESEPLLEPELRAACARLFVELGDPERGLVQAERAFEADPERPVTRLTFALAAVRTARRRSNDALLSRADKALSQLAGREGPAPALYQALKACVQAKIGDPERAISIAQRALGLDPRSPDALAAIAEASARLQHVHDARQAFTRLAELAPEEAECLVPVLRRLGLPVGEELGGPFAARAPLWGEAELELASGHRSDAVRAVEQAAQEMLRRADRTASQSGLTALATVSAGFLTAAPVFSSFAPYDLSLWSVRRVEAAIDVLYGLEKRPRLPSDDAALVLLVGVYLGEALRIAHRGKWEGSLVDIDAARVVVRERHWQPFRIVAARLHQGGRATIGDAVSAALSTSGGEPWRSRLANPVAPPTPWAPAAWPKPSTLSQFGRSLARSPIGRYCQDFAEGPLDRTTTSLIGLDSYLALIAPTTAPTDPDAAWTRRVAVTIGGYVGETIRDIVGGEWTYGADSADDAHAFRLVLRGKVEAFPVQQVLERVIGTRSSSLVDYAKTLIGRAGRL